MLRLLLRLTLLPLLLSRLIRRTGLPGLTSAIRRAGRLRRARPLLQIILPLVGLTRRVVAVRLRPTQRALFGHNLAPCDLRGMHLAHDALVAAACCGEIASGLAVMRPPAPGRSVKPLEPWVSEPSRTPLRSLTSMWPTLPSASG